MPTVLGGGGAANLATATGTLLAADFPALTGNVTTNAGSLATTIAALAVTNAMLAGGIDLAAKVTGSLPIGNGGTGQATAGPALDALTIAGSDIASASTTNIATATGLFVNIAGVTTITALGTATAGVVRMVKFAGILTLTHNSTSLILPGLANVTTAAGDHAIFISLGSGNWRCLYFSALAGSNAGTITGALTHTGSTVGFFSTTPAARPSAYTQTYATATRTHSNPTSVTLTDNSTGTADTTLEDVSGINFVAGKIANNFADLAAQVNALNVDMLVVKKLLNSVIDDLQTLGLLQ